MYEHFGVSKLTYVEEDVDHYFLTGYMLPGLKQLYVDLGYADNLDDFNPPTDAPDGQWADFNQGEFVGIGSNVSFADSKWGSTGKVFIPTSCHSTTCRVHISIHGCSSNADTMAYRSEFVAFASTNNIIVVYPNSECWGISETGEVLFPNDSYNSLYVQATNDLICRLTSTEADNNCRSGASSLVQVASAMAVTAFSIFQ